MSPSPPDPRPEAKHPSDPPPSLADTTAVRSGSLLQRLLQRGLGTARYRLQGEIARGGMGAVLRVWDEDLRRHLAMKVTLESTGPSGANEGPPMTRTLARFFEEAQITGQLDHPGIVPVHELGIASDGRVFFTMKLVKGDTLKEALDRSSQGAGDWPQARVVATLLRVCEAMAYAHEKGVIHRDLKPSNVMLGRHGEVYVMDWGLARILAEPDERDVRIREVSATTTMLASERQDLAGEDFDSPVVTMDGDVVGTPSYMSPEQALGQAESVGPASDVYSVGAMLYHALAGHMPYVPSGSKASPYAILKWVREVPPASLGHVAPHASAELVAICDKAMERDPKRRYPTMEALRDDLRAYLERRVVRAYRTGAVVELRKWVSRNRGAAAAMAALLLVVGGAGYAIANVESRRAEQVALDAEAGSAAQLAREAPDQWPSTPARIPEIRDWVARARALADRGPRRRAEIEALRAGGSRAESAQELAPPGNGFLTPAQEERETRRLADQFAAAAAKTREAAASAPGGSEQRSKSAAAVEVFDAEDQRCRARAAALARAMPWRERWRFESIDAQRRHDQLAGLLRDLEEIASSGLSGLADVESRLTRAEALRAEWEQAGAGWRDAIASVADRSQCPRYDGLLLRAQYGLEPLQRNAESGLWEFWMPLSGAKPKVDAAGRAAMDGETAIVLVLIPGGTFAMGAQATSPGAPHFDPTAEPTQGPVRDVTLDPYFLSKFEMTQGQWIRLTGSNPSRYYSGFETRLQPGPVTRAHPVEQVTWDECVRVLARLGLELPTEAQWERAARAGSELTYGVGAEPDSLAKLVNAADVSLGAAFAGPKEKYSDGYIVHAPVGRFAPNAFGLYDVLGNVREWCRDWIHTDGYVADETIDPRDGLRGESILRKLAKAHRGGSYSSPLSDLRIARRYARASHSSNEDLGVRPARCLER